MQHSLLMSTGLRMHGAKDSLGSKANQLTQSREGFRSTPSIEFLRTFTQMKLLLYFMHQLEHLMFFQKGVPPKEALISKFLELGS
jgi:hypothetical protein